MLCTCFVQTFSSHRNGAADMSFGGYSNSPINQAAQTAADELACFGWVQQTSANTIAGEGRCSKATGQSQSFKTYKLIQSQSVACSTIPCVDHPVSPASGDCVLGADARASVRNPSIPCNKFPRGAHLLAGEADIQ